MRAQLASILGQIVGGSVRDPAAGAPNKKRTPLHTAVCDRNCAADEVARLAAQMSQRLEERDYRGQTPLMCAIKRRRADVARHLLAAGADPLATCDRGYTPLHLAIAFRDPEMLGVALGAAKNAGRAVDAVRVSPTVCAGEGLLHMAVLSKDLQVLLAVLRFAREAMPKAVSEAVPGAGAAAGGPSPIDARNAKGITPLMLATMLGTKAAMAVLLRAGAAADAAREPGGWTALHKAAAHGKTGRMAVLLAGGANPDVAKADGFTALHLAALNNYTECVAMLLCFDADLAPRTADAPALPEEHRARTALDLAADGGFSRTAALLRTAASPRALDPPGAAAPQPGVEAVLPE